MKKIIYTLFILISLTAISIVMLESFSHYTVSKTIHPDAPVITRKSITINAPIDTVWKIFSDVNHWSSWQTEIHDATINGAFATGTYFDWKSNGLTIHSTLQSVEVKKSVAWSGPAFGSFAIHTWYFSQENGHTLIRVEESMEGWLVSAMKNMFQAGLDNSIDHWLSALKAQSERYQ